MIDYFEILENTINTGIEAAKADYIKNKDKLEGATAGFEACKNKKFRELIEIQKEANEYQEHAFREHAENYWWFRCYQSEIEFVLRRMKSVMLLFDDKDIVKYFT